MPDTSVPDNPYVLALQDLDTKAREVVTLRLKEFLTDNLARVQQYGHTTRFSDQQQAVIRHMVERYLSPERAAERAGQSRLFSRE